MNTTAPSAPAPGRLTRPGGALAYDVRGTGPLLARPWGAGTWTTWFSKLHRRPPADLAERVAAIRSMIRQPGRLAALQAMAGTDCAEVDAALDAITAPTLVVMGSDDPDFDDPATEAAAIAQRVPGRVLMVQGAGHYPHIEVPDEVLPAIVGHVTAGSDIADVDRPSQGR